jgi:hypothetical protein
MPTLEYLLDESLQRPLGRLLVGHAVRTVGQAGWASFKNGVLLELAATDFDVLITADQNLEFQQNLDTLPLAVLVLVADSNRLEALEPLVPKIHVAVRSGLAPQNRTEERQSDYTECRPTSTNTIGPVDSS